MINDQTITHQDLQTSQFQQQLNKSLGNLRRMNIVGQMKNVKKKSNYIVNVSFDIPIQPDKFLLSQPVSGQFTITPNYPKKSMKLKLGSAGTTQQAQSRKLSCATDTLCVNSSRNHKKNQNNIPYKYSQNTTKHSKNLSFSHSKSPPKISNKVQRSVSSYNNHYDIKAFHKKIAYQIDDEIIGYTNPSAQLRIEQQKMDSKTARTQKNSLSKQAQLKRSPIMTPIMKKYEKVQTQEMQLLNGIKKFEKKAKQRKENLNLEYIKQKILMQSCARKIQRAWRNFKTRKLINAYSSTASLKLTNKTKGLMYKNQQYKFEHKKILNVKSCGYKNGKNQMKKSIKQSKQYFVEEIKQKQRVNSNFQGQNLMEKMQYKKKIQMQQIQKWESLIKDLRKTKNIQQVLHKTRQHKIQLQPNYQNGLKIKKQKPQLNDQELKNTINKIQDEQLKSEIQKSLQNYQKKVNKKFQLQKSKYNFFHHDSPDVEDAKKQDQVQHNEEQKDRNQIQSHKQEYTQQFQKYSKFSMYHKLIDSEELVGRVQKQDQTSSKQQIDSDQISAQKKLLTNFEYLIKQYEESDRNFLKSNVQQKVQEIVQNIKQRIKIISDEVYRKQINGAAQQIAHIIRKIKIPRKIKQNLSQGSEQKAEGICTNMQSIKDYLQNLISYIFDQCPEKIIQGFNTAIGPSAHQLFQRLRIMDSMPHDNAKIFCQEEVMDKRLFNKHWEFASKQIYFQNKYSDPQRQKQRIDRLKQITKVYFSGIFDSFNQCLSPYRVYGLKGEPLPWESIVRTQRIMEDINSLKPYIKHAYKDLAQLSVVFCGVNVQNRRPRLPQQMIQQIQEQRMHIFLAHDLKKAEHSWAETSFYKTQIMFHVSLFIMEKEINQFTWQLMTLSKSIKHGRV